MKPSPYRISLDGVAPDALDRRIYPTDVLEAAPKVKVTTAARPLGGLRAVRRETQSRAVTVRFAVWERDKVQRAALMRKVMDWASAGGLLSVGYRDGQVLRVICDRLPDISGRGWTDELELGFTAYDPYWRSVDAMTAVFTAGAGETAGATMQPDGTADETPLMLEAVNTSGEVLTSLTVTAGGRSIALRGLALGAGKALTADYGEDGYLRIRADGATVLGRRTAESADELMLLQRERNTVSVTADRAVRVTLRAYARWV